MWQLLKKYFMPIYISPLDQFLQHFDETHSPSATQQREIARCSRLRELRDQEDSLEHTR